MALPANVIKEDRRLDQAASAASEELARLRWHWTLDESNAERVGLREYARAVGRDHKTIRAHAEGYKTWAGGGAAPSSSLNQEVERAKLGGDRLAATEAVAEIRGVTVQTARKTRPTEVRRVLETARERAEQRGTSVEEEVLKVADWTVRSEKAARQVRDDRRRRMGLRFVELEEALARMYREGRRAVDIAATVEWGDEERELLQGTLAQIKALIGLLDLVWEGSAEIDWDAELAQLEGENA